MLNVFSLANGRLFQEEIESLDALARVKPIWVDLDAPTPEEKGWIAQHYGLTIPQDVVDEDLEESARFYEEDNGELHIRSDFLIDDDVTPRNVRVAFILHRQVLFSVHAEDLPVFRLLRLRSEVFVVEQHCIFQDMDGSDPATRTAYLRDLQQLARRGEVVHR